MGKSDVSGGYGEWCPYGARSERRETGRTPLTHRSLSHSTHPILVWPEGTAEPVQTRWDGNEKGCGVTGRAVDRGQRSEGAEME